MAELETPTEVSSVALVPVEKGKDVKVGSSVDRDRSLQHYSNSETLGYRPRTMLLRGSHLDSLAYLDDEKEMSSKREHIDLLVAEEAAKGPHRIQYYLQMVPAHDQLPTTSTISTLIENMESPENLKSPFGSIDLTRYDQQSQAPPYSDARDCRRGWETVFRDLDVQIEHANSALTNHELLRRYGASLWRVSNHELDIAIQRLEKRVQDMKRETLKVNRKRKADQLQVGKTLAKLRREYDRTVQKNTAIIAALTTSVPKQSKLTEKKVHH